MGVRVKVWSKANQRRAMFSLRGLAPWCMVVRWVLFCCDGGIVAGLGLHSRAKLQGARRLWRRKYAACLQLGALRMASCVRLTTEPWGGQQCYWTSGERASC